MESPNSTQGRKLLYEVSYIRPTIIFLLVVSHSFTKIHKGAGIETQPYELAEAYLWLVRLIFNNSLLLCTSCCGIIALYITVIHFTNREGFVPPKWVINASSDCNGVYVYHQFILVWLYFYTPLVSSSPALLVPVVGLLVALSTSLLLTRLSLKTRFGRYLIG